MKAPIGFTDIDQVRSVLGVSRGDLPDRVLMARGLDVELRLDLATWLPTADTLFTAGRATAALPGEAAIADALSLYSAYFCAALIAKSGPLLVAQQISDGKNTLARFTPIAWDKVQADMAAQAAKYKGVIDTLLAQTTTEVGLGGINLFSTVGLATDPVTDAGQGA
jgi:hypothetical protein